MSIVNKLENSNQLSRLFLGTGRQSTFSFFAWFHSENYNKGKHLRPRRQRQILQDDKNHQVAFGTCFVRHYACLTDSNADPQ